MKKVPPGWDFSLVHYRTLKLHELAAWGGTFYSEMYFSGSFLNDSKFSLR